MSRGWVHLALWENTIMQITVASWNIINVHPLSVHPGEHLREPVTVSLHFSPSEPPWVLPEFEIECGGHSSIHGQFHTHQKTSPHAQHHRFSGLSVADKTHLIAINMILTSR